jgi:hypothetical protein
MYSATNAASAALDFSKGNAYLFAISIAGLPVDPHPTAFTFANASNVRTPQRQLCCKASLCDKEEAKEKDPVHYSVKVPVEPGLVSPAS